MDISVLQTLAGRNLWGAITPEIMLGSLALLLLVIELLFPKQHRQMVPVAALVGLVSILGGVLLNFQSAYLGEETFNGLLRHTHGGQVMRVFFLLAAIMVCVIARVSLAKQTLPRVEFYHIVLVVTAAMMLLAQSNHLVLFFVALETVTIGLYILVSYYRTSLTLEAGLKYLIMGALSSSLMLFGIVLLYGVAGNPALPAHTAHSMHYGELAAFLAANPHNFLASVGIVLVLSGVAFKIGAFPFQIWVPDVYQGAPTPVTAFLAVSSKAVGFTALLALAGTVFASYGWLVGPVLTFFAATTLLFGNFAALTQHNVKRLIGLSGVSHAGFLILGVAAVSRAPMAVGAIYFYLFAYLLASFAVFGVMAHVAGANDADQELDHYAGLAKTHPFLALVLAVGLGSLAGIPPLVGFMGKLFIFIAAFQAGLYSLLAVAILGVVISIYYYFGWIKAAFFETWATSPDAPARPARTPVDLVTGLALGALALSTVVLGFYQGPLGAWLTPR